MSSPISQLPSSAEPVESAAPAVPSAPEPEWTRFSASRLWQWQREYFEQRGVAAWSSGQVPHYITSNPYAAASFAGAVMGWLRDWTREPAGGSQPFYIIELGAGSGRFAFHFLRRFLRMLKGSALRDVPVKYVMTDFCEATIEFWRTHEMLRRFADAGALDFARFDAGSSREVHLLESGETLQPGSGRPLAAIANYCFDSIPADAFAITDGKLMECLISVPAEAVPPDGSNPDFFAHLGIQAERRELTGEPYANPVWNAVLRRYEKRLDNTTVLFPAAAIDTIENLAALSGGRLMVLSADRGFDREEMLLGLDNPRMISHGSFSIPVNYDALARVIRASGGEFLQSPHAPAHLCVNAMLLGQPAGGYLETAEAFYNSAGRWGPDDFFLLKKGIQKIVTGLDLDETLSALRLSGWDSNLFQHCVQSLAAHSKTATPVQREELLRAIAGVWENYFPIGAQEDIGALLGQLLLEMHLPAEALKYFDRSLHYAGPSAGAWLRLATAYYQLSDLDAAGRYVEQALLLEPGNGPARALALQVERDRERCAG